MEMEELETELRLFYLYCEKRGIALSRNTQTLVKEYIEDMKK